MKFPLLANAFGHQKLILEIGGNAIGVSEPRYQPQQHRRRRSGDYVAARKGNEAQQLAGRA